METLRKEGLSLNEDLEKQVSELEENIIKKEILPVVKETIAPALKQVQRELVLVVDYHPGEPISVALSRKTNISALIDAKRLEADPEVEHKEFGPRKNRTTNIAPKTGLSYLQKRWHNTARTRCCNNIYVSYHRGRIGKGERVGFEVLSH